ncbi:SRPBCC family protein [Mucilaginibacter corticis]|uniref:SRPBCC family protein n=1 Tax=Mucilaginibacter corticis TaxID=2597670 RepID=A0A556MFA9_9SPHI|nr:SRPBCC family protein [Mucilaginibacter corticis]TSJ38550.1 SRPBCC family protein [Mucilaginibacter corticis]
MSIIITIVSILAGIIALIMIIALFMKKGYKTYSEIIINAPLPKAFDYIKQIKNQDNFNKWVMVDPDMKKDFRGTDGTVGFVYAWNGNKQAGEGEQEIKAITEGKNIEMEIRFIRPFAGIAQAEMTTESLSDNQTKVSWSTASTMKYPINIMLPMIVKMLEKDMAASLTMLKNVLEK